MIRFIISSLYLIRFIISSLYLIRFIISLFSNVHLLIEIFDYIINNQNNWLEAVHQFVYVCV